MAAVKQYGKALEFASEALQNYREIVMAAVKQNGKALNKTSNGIRGDKEIVLEAVRKNGEAFEFSSLQLRGDCDFVLEAAAHKKYSLQHANLTRLVRDNTTSPAKFCKILSCFDSITSILLSLGKGLIFSSMDYCSKH